MSKRKGLSLDEKREKVLEVFHETSDVFVFKDVEKLAAKKGVVLQTIKEVLQSLVDDDLVHQEKIGSSNYFWSFPSEATVKLENDATRMENELLTLKRQKQALVFEVDALKRSQQNAGEREQYMKELQRLELQVKSTCEQIQQYADSDPDKFEALRRGSLVAREAANRWLDNLLALEAWCKKKLAGRENEVSTFFEQSGFSCDMEYLEWSHQAELGSVRPGKGRYTSKLGPFQQPVPSTLTVNVEAGLQMLATIVTVLGPYELHNYILFFLYPMKLSNTWG